MNSKSIIFRALEYYGTRLEHRGNERVLNWLRRITGADIDEELTVRRGRWLWALNPSDFVHQDVFWHGTKDTWDVWHVLRILEQGAVIVDVGSNFGYYAIYLGGELGGGTRVLAFEPFSKNYERLQRNIHLNDLHETVTAFPLALSDQDDKARIQVRARNNSGSARIIKNGGEGEAIETAKLDNIWASAMEKDASCSLIKIDVEGHEISVLRGAIRLLKEHRPCILIEIDPPRLAEAGSSVEEVQDFLDQLGYLYFRTLRERLVKTNPSMESDLVNLICLHRNRHRREIEFWSDNA